MKLKSRQIQSVRGMHDILPEEQKYWRYIQKKIENLLEYYGFERISTPVLESADLFNRAVGETSDIISKEIYTLKTKGGDTLALRPEATAGLVRAYLENGMNVRPHPVKLYYYGPMFRHDQPQQGRYRARSSDCGFEHVRPATGRADVHQARPAQAAGALAPIRHRAARHRPRSCGSDAPHAHGR